ncbi:AGE family epimerase/isomerase [Neiella sp. HB171785]|uniref:AGE family epimerase/isomerase n=1 Tax=Neiella litorisoli TaxID=2771431 RepID=A0A8J6UJD0_9GAMM|nr:AGE family epimerase/isomerase [Neiella litorisoli]MBD1390408.1 AGE family epimerase/isomerase [Neiella litorisoli]
MEALAELKSALQEEMRVCILPFWMYKASDQQTGGYWGSVKANGYIDKQADKGGILHARLLWAFSRAHLTFGDQSYADHASRTHWFMQQQLTSADGLSLHWSAQQQAHFASQEDWVVTQAYYLYALSTYALIDDSVLAQSHQVFAHLQPELHTLLQRQGKAGDVWRAFLHVTEALDAYGSLPQADSRAQPLLMQALARAVELLECADVADYEQLNWGRIAATSWLLPQVAQRHGHDEIVAAINKLGIKLQHSVAELAANCSGEGVPLNQQDPTRYGWVQAEVLVSLWQSWRQAPSPDALKTLIAHWQFIYQFISDRQFGEWKLQATGEATPEMEKAGFWKCPYHNFRACLTVYNEISKLIS